MKERKERKERKGKAGKRMGISFNFPKGLKTDYSGLFQSISGSGVSNLNFLSDYASIKNGSYGKLMKAYYAKDSATQKHVSSIVDQKKSSISVSKDSAQTLEAVEKATDGLKESADKLIDTGKDAVFTKDREAVYQAVSSFVEDYNKVIEQTGKASSDSISNRVKTLKIMTQANSRMLGKVGITLGEDDRLSIDKEAFNKASETTLQSLFHDHSSYAYHVSAQASLIDYAAEREASKANTYTGAGSYSNTYAAGNLYDSIF